MRSILAWIYGSEKNLGILGGFKALAESLTTDMILLVENDCPLITNLQDAKAQIEHGYDLLMRQKQMLFVFEAVSIRARLGCRS